MRLRPGTIVLWDPEEVAPESPIIGIVVRPNDDENLGPQDGWEVYWADLGDTSIVLPGEITVLRGARKR